jgi:hypothetical protein
MRPILTQQIVICSASFKIGSLWFACGFTVEVRIGEGEHPRAAKMVEDEVAPRACPGPTVGDLTEVGGLLVTLGSFTRAATTGRPHMTMTTLASPQPGQKVNFQPEV